MACQECEEIQMMAQDWSSRITLCFISVPQENNIHAGKTKTKIKITNLKPKV